MDSTYQYCQIWPGLAGNCLAKLQVLQTDVVLLDSQVQSVCEQQRILETYRSQLIDGLALLEQLNSHVQDLNDSLSESLYPFEEIFEQIDCHAVEIHRLYESMDANLRMVQKIISHVS